MAGRFASVFSDVLGRFNRWRIILLVILLVYAIFLAMYLDIALIQWDETQHLVGGLHLSRGQFQDYLHFSYYPPLFDSTTALAFLLMGPSLFAARLVSLAFGVLSVWVVFEYAYRMYGPKQAILSSVLLATMPGFIILCRMALIETMLLFFFSVSLLLFFSWLQTNNEKMLLLSGVALGMGVLAKYQTIVGGVVMLVSWLLMFRKRLTRNVRKFVLLVIVAAAIVVPWLLVMSQQITPEDIARWFYTVSSGSDERVEYGRRIPLPIFYMVEMTYPYMDLHPISLPIYIIAFLGLSYWIWRRKPEDKFSLIWFIVVYVFYTLFISNRNWRYVIPLFSILAVSASDFILLIWNKLKAPILIQQTKRNRMLLRKVAAALFVVLIAASVIYSLMNAYYWVEKEHVQVRAKAASQYISENSRADEAAVLLFPVNYFSPDAVNFYLLQHDSSKRVLLEYPKDPADVYTPVFNETVLIQHCESLNVKFLLLYENGNKTYYQTDMKAYDVLDILVDSDNFMLETIFGSNPQQVYVIRYLPNATE
ncbi:phospholipid carrier-dependent glycosyltransferase [Candidatus Bathyarchaeota archaeon]|nr:phospholipid carrier-dependent glycosyltransferase [Candidatus Bathyarchaeota archaeon]